MSFFVDICGQVFVLGDHTMKLFGIEKQNLGLIPGINGASIENITGFTSNEKLFVVVFTESDTLGISKEKMTNALKLTDVNFVF
jgi:hypothetical protein